MTKHLSFGLPFLPPIILTAKGNGVNGVHLLRNTELKQRRDCLESKADHFDSVRILALITAHQKLKVCLRKWDCQDYPISHFNPFRWIMILRSYPIAGLRIEIRICGRSLTRKAAMMQENE